MWIMIYWICVGSGAPCVTNQIAAFSTESICKQAVFRLESENSIVYSDKVKAVCVNSDISYFE